MDLRNKPSGPLARLSVLPVQLSGLPQRVIQNGAKLGLAVWLWIAAGVALAILLAWFTWPRAAEVDVATIDRGAVRREIVDEGRTRIHDVFVVSATVAGMLERIELEPGDTVSRGQVVATIKPAESALLDARAAAEARAGIAAAQSALRAAEAQYDLAGAEQRRVVSLHAKDYASRAALDTANAALRAARAQTAARRADLQRAQAAVASPSVRAGVATPVISPAAGRMLRLLQESQAVVPAGAPLLEIGDPQDLEIVAEFLSQDAVLIRPGAEAFIEGWGGATPIPARVNRIEPNAHTKVSALGVEEQRVNVILHLAQPDRALPPLGHGYRVDVGVVVFSQDDALRVPTEALVRDGTEWSVFKVQHGRARLSAVQLGDGGERYRVVQRGLAEGDRVILFPGDAVKDGDRVRARAKAN